MFWDCLTCDYSCHYNKDDGVIKMMHMAVHEIYHNLYMGYEIEIVTGDVIPDEVPSSRHGRRTDPGMEDLVCSASGEDERRTEVAINRLRKTLASKRDPQGDLPWRHGKDGSRSS